MVALGEFPEGLYRLRQYIDEDGEPETRLEPVRLHTSLLEPPQIVFDDKRMQLLHRMDEVDTLD